jgi:peptidoglycan/xylan/chitin deacetylase (PgdA/CDA1 family)
MTTLSVCCLTSDPGARVAAIMRQLRPVAEEIVVAVDSRLDPHRLGRYAEVADRLLRYEFVDSAQQAIPWIATQCTGDWILLIDGDEVVSPTLVERLPELIGAREVFQYLLPCRWLFPDADHYLAQPPWHFSTPRLVRNDPATLWHAGLSHGRFEPVFPSVHLSEGFYHLSLLVNDLAYRDAKVAHYLSIDSDHSRRVLEVDLAAFYVPERDLRFGVAPVPVPSRDRDAIAEVLAAEGEERPGPPVAEIPMWSWSEIQSVWPRRTLPETAYRGGIEAFERTPRLHAGQRRPVTVRVSNAGTEHWPGLEREPWIKLSHRWRAPNGSTPEAWTDTCLPACLAPGASALVPVAIQAPPSAGRHTLELELVHEDLSHGEVIGRFAAASLPIEVEAVGGSPWERLVRAGPGGRLRRSLWRPRRAHGIEGVARLTFDDGPSDWTEPLLEVLRTYSIRATFFVVGRNARRRPELVQAAARDGHEIANHTEDHAALPLLADDAAIAASLLPTSDLIEELTGRRPRLFRPPWGLTNEAVERVAGSLGMEQLLWTSNPHDYTRPGAKRIAAAIQAGGASDVVLLHDGAYGDVRCDRKQTVDGVALALAALSLEPRLGQA